MFGQELNNNLEDEHYVPGSRTVAIIGCASFLLMTIPMAVKALGANSLVDALDFGRISTAQALALPVGLIVLFVGFISAFQSGKKGFVVLSVVSGAGTVAPLLLALLLPFITHSRLQANETAAIQTIRTIGLAELTYANHFPANGYACTLAALGGDPKSGPKSPQAAQLLDAQFAATGQKSGYLFTISGCTKANVNKEEIYTSYRLVAIPLVVGKTGHNGYCSDENNSLKIDPDGGTNCTIH